MWIPPSIVFTKFHDDVECSGITEAALAYNEKQMREGGICAKHVE